MNSEENRTLTLLTVEDNPDDIHLLKEMTSEMNTVDFPADAFQFDFITSLKEAETYLSRRRPDIILLDLHLPDSKGLQTLKTFRRLAPDTPIVILTVLDNREHGAEAVKLGAQEYLLKSAVTPGLLVKSIRYALERQRLKMELENETRQLQQREAQLLEIISQNPDGMVIVDCQGLIHFMNPAAETMLDRTLDMHQGTPFGFPPTTGESIEIKIPRGERPTLTAEMRAVPFQWQGQEAFLISLRNISPKIQLRYELAEEKERLDVTLRSIADGVIATCEKGIIRIINWVAADMTGWKQHEAAGKPLEQVFQITDGLSTHPLPPPHLQVMKKGHILESPRDVLLLSRDHSETPIEYSCAPIRSGRDISGAVLVIRDVTEKKAMEDELNRARNLEALGMLAGGIAHEYNNVLTTTLGYISLAREQSGGDEKLSTRLQKVEEAAGRARDISGRLLTFSKGGEPRKERGSLLKTAEEAASHILENKTIHICWTISDDLWPLEYDHSQIHQAFQNIIRNAAEAMPQGGEIEIDMENVMVPFNRYPALKRGNYVKITVKDPGAGIPDENIARIFAPYFTTKPGAEGMGLTIVYSIVKKHGGWLRVKSRETHGTSVTILLPASLYLMDEPETTSPLEIFPHDLGGEKGKILVMDDEEAVRETIEDMLDFLQYECVPAENGEAALEYYRSAMAGGAPFDAVILDLTVPSGMGGKECIKHLRQIDPNSVAIVSSGYSNDPVISDYRAYNFDGVLPKPYKIQDLNDLLEKIMREKK